MDRFSSAGSKFCWFLVLNLVPPQPVLLSFDAEVQKMTSLMEENEQQRQMVSMKQGSLGFD